MLTAEGGYCINRRHFLCELLLAIMVEKYNKHICIFTDNLYLSVALVYH